MGNEISTLIAKMNELIGTGGSLGGFNNKIFFIDSYTFCPKQTC
jgi:hypothetical protein